MLLRGKSKESSGKVSPPNPSPAYMDSKQFGMCLLLCKNLPLLAGQFFGALLT